MNPRVLELAERQGALKARIAQQRASLSQEIQPLADALGLVDKGMAGVDWLKHHPAAVGGATLALAVLRPRAVWRWGKRGFFLWRGWQTLKQKIQRL